MPIYNVIKNDGPGKVLVWKYTEEDFNNNSQLIIAESEEALFVKDGIIVQKFPAGKYTLNTANYPFIGALQKMMTGGNSPFNCKVYFINIAHNLELRWGTDPPIQIEDARFGIVSVGALGSYSIKVKDGKKLLTKLIGNNVQFYTADQINEFFRTAFVSKIKINIAKYIKQENKSIIELITEYEKVGETLIPILSDVLDEYGIELVNFYIGGINIPEDDSAYIRIKDAVARKKRMGEYGDEYGRLTGEMLLENMSKSPSASGMASGSMGVGMGVVAGGVISGITAQVFAPVGQAIQNGNAQPVPAKDDNIISCPACSMKNNKNAKFCSECGKKLQIELVKCQNCGAEMSAETKFCSECGQRNKE